MDNLPISIIVPIQKHREGFFRNFVYPMLRISNCLEILIDDCEKSHVSTKRNRLAKQAKGEYIFVCDDDCILPMHHIERLYDALKDTKHSFAYTDYYGIVMNHTYNPIGANYLLKSQKFNAKTLKISNYISPVALYRKKDWIDFDATLDKLEDWDLFLTMLDKGKTGLYVEGTRFLAFFNDEGRSTTPNEQKIRDLIKKKHNIK